MAKIESSLIIGLVLGGLYAVVSLGFVLVYKATRVLNLSQGQFGAAGALLFVWLIFKHDWSYGPAFVAALTMCAALGIAIEFLIIRRLSNASALVVTIATLGLSQVIFATGQLAVPPAEITEFHLITGFPQPFEFHHEVLGVVLNGGEVLVLILVPIITAALALFLRLTRFGVGMRAAADNGDNARLLSVSPRLVAVTAWGFAGAVSALAAILINATTGSSGQLYFGTGLLLKALAPALLAGLTNIPRAAIAGLGIGLLQSFILTYTLNSNIVDLAIFIAVILGLLLQAQGKGRARELGGVAFVTDRASAARIAAANPAARRALRRAACAACCAFAVLLAFQVPSATANLLSIGIAFAIVGMSVGLLTGLSGQVSLGQWAIAGAGAYAAAQASTHWHLNVLAVVAFSMAAGTVVSVAIGIPALRLRGLLLSVTTLAFAVAASTYFFSMGWADTLNDSPQGVTRPDFLGVSLAKDNAFYLFALGCLGVALLFSASIRGGRLGRNLVAVRENERTAAVMGINIAGTKLLGFALSGALAGLGGAVFVLASQGITASDFPADYSFLVVSMAVVGGVGTLSGPIVGALLLWVVPGLFPGNTNAQIIGSGVGVLAVMLVLPGGLVGLVGRFGRFLVAPVATATEGAVDAPAPRPAVAVGPAT